MNLQLFFFFFLLMPNFLVTRVYIFYMNVTKMVDLHSKEDN